jgi:hypothetical protein
MNIITPITTSVSLAFLPAYRWDKHLERAKIMCRIELDAITEDIAERYAREAMADATSGTDSINRHWRTA